MRYIYFLVIAILIFGCAVNPIERSIRIQSDDCAQAPCVVNIEKLTSFKWDKMYVFKYTATQEEITKIVGVRTLVFTEFTGKIIFTLNEEIVHFEEQKTDIERPIDDQIVFDIPDSSNYAIFSVRQSIFTVNKVDFSDGQYYKLSKLLK